MTPPAAGASVVTALGGVVLDGRQPNWTRSGTASPTHGPARTGGGLFSTRVQSEDARQNAHLTSSHGFPEVREDRRGQPVGRSTRSRAGKSDGTARRAVQDPPGDVYEGSPRPQARRRETRSGQTTPAQERRGSMQKASHSPRSATGLESATMASAPLCLHPAANSPTKKRPTHQLTPFK